jgi:hypothetical protein
LWEPQIQNKRIKPGIVLCTGEFCQRACHEHEAALAAERKQYGRSDRSDFVVFVDVQKLLLTTIEGNLYALTATRFIGSLMYLFCEHINTILKFGKYRVHVVWQQIIFFGM